MIVYLLHNCCTLRGLRGGHAPQLLCDGLLQAEGALTAQKRAEVDAAAAAKAHESTLASEKEHYSGLLQRSRAAQVSSCQDHSGRQLMEYCCYPYRPGLHACHPEKPSVGCDCLSELSLISNLISSPESW